MFKNFLENGEFDDANERKTNDAGADVRADVSAGKTSSLNGNVKTSLQNDAYVTTEEVFKAHHDLSWSSGVWNLKLDFIWAPIVNESMIQV